MTTAAAPAKKARAPKPVLEAVPDADHPGNSKFARALGSGDFHTREKGLQALSRFLLRKSEIREADMMKIWKGLFYCFWHSDKAPVQAELADRLAALMSQLSDQSAYLYFTCFMATMRREWFGIDRLRLDKFLMLIRKLLRAMLARLAASKWRPDLVSRYADFVRGHVLLPADTLPALGVAFHTADVLLDELRAVADGRPLPGAALAALLAPFCALLQAGEQATLNRVGEGLFDSLLSELAAPTDDSPYLQNLDVAAMATRLFDMGAEPATRARNRQVLYDLSSALERLQRKRQRLGTGGEAGPSSQPANGAAAEGGKKKNKKQQEAAAAAAAVADKGKVAAPAAASALRAAAVGQAAAAAAAAAAEGTGRKQRKAAAAAAAAEGEPAGADAHANGDAASAKPKKQSLGTRAQAEETQPEAAAPAGNKSSKKRQRHEQNGAAELAAAAAAAAAAAPAAKGAAAPTPLPLAAAAAAGSAKQKNKKSAAKEPTTGQKMALMEALAGLAASGDAAAAAAGEPNGAKRKLRLSTVAADAAAAAPAAEDPAAKAPAQARKQASPGSGKATPEGKAPQAARQAMTEAKAEGALAHATRTALKRAAASAKKARVVINLKKNLYFEHGGPVPDPDIRTPPPARAKGGILKTVSVSCPPKVQPHAGNAPKQADRPQRARVVPKQTRRASAAAFF